MLWTPFRVIPAVTSSAMRSAFLLSLIVFSAAAVAAQDGRTHRLEATPATVAYGYYWSDAKPVLRVQSGDIIDVDTLLTSTPMLPKNGRNGISMPGAK